MGSLELSDFDRGAIWRVPGAPDELLRDGGAWKAERDLFAIVLSVELDCSKVRCLIAAPLDPINRPRVEVDPTSVQLDDDDTDAPLGPFAVVDCSNVRTFTDVLFSRGTRIGAIRHAAKMREVDEAVVRGLELGQYGAFSE